VLVLCRGLLHEAVDAHPFPGREFAPQPYVSCCRVLLHLSLRHQSAPTAILASRNSEPYGVIIFEDESAPDCVLIHVYREP
jgi:hypothetical protein